MIPCFNLSRIWESTRPLRYALEHSLLVPKYIRQWGGTEGREHKSIDLFRIRSYLPAISVQSVADEFHVLSHRVLQAHQQENLCAYLILATSSWEGELMPH